MPVLKKYDEKGAYYQFGDSGKKYYVEEHGDEEARKLAVKQGQAIKISEE